MVLCLDKNTMIKYYKVLIFRDLGIPIFSLIRSTLSTFLVGNCAGRVAKRSSTKLWETCDVACKPRLQLIRHNLCITICVEELVANISGHYAWRTSAVITNRGKAGARAAWGNPGLIVTRVPVDELVAVGGVEASLFNVKASLQS
jgi:hypothetical protein